MEVCIKRQCIIDDILQRECSLLHQKTVSMLVYCVCNKDLWFKASVDYFVSTVTRYISGFKECTLISAGDNVFIDRLPNKVDDRIIVYAASRPTWQ